MVKIVAYTNAPLDFDWGYTKTLIDNYAVYKVAGSDLALRKISIDGQHEANMQIGRYWSGMYITLPQERLVQLIKEGYVLINELDKQIPHHVE